MEEAVVTTAMEGADEMVDGIGASSRQGVPGDGSSFFCLSLGWLGVCFSFFFGGHSLVALEGFLL
jgi:hypothetical protein